MQKKFLLLTVVLAFVLQACGSPVTQDAALSKTSDAMEAATATSKPAEMMAETMQPDPAVTPDAMMEKPTDAMLPVATETSGAMMDDMSMPAWMGASLTNVHTGEAFSLADYQGKVILVETMAVWCTNCRKQQEQVKALHALLGGQKDFISLGLDIDPNEDDADLKAFTEKNGFDWLYAVATPEIAREIGNLYGAQFLNPPSTPMLVIDRHGEAHPLPFGIKSADDLLKALQPFLTESM